ncbi:crossover junction endodeoxyribonuclease RuvC [Alkalilimnicola ehrlichii]|uniref:Crossover junction endodeoxyribonuclease RuvC n=1 Tax=Alkalilimnicola ehrlichii TaxID=351052 RepID=A0A3E0X144_9GAMM|nr:crossover junction endodeoxyribonuclease RuvC [Alkalilimnicola ehrlichii]RFA31355.1 crossover junction endodeoxyribonuclease RuvC [Alkalilimnicola ehrlichii]RFA39373.1 crossover junction endodeoxyribonuclease RuvC [Alkalilimnicola ehrlichii]
MQRILGIDPGSRITGYGIIDVSSGTPRYVTSGTIRTEGKAFPERLKQIYEQLSELLHAYQPEQSAIEEVFVHRNPNSALKLGQARGAAICACVVAGLPVAEYTPREIKQAVVGGGGAGKDQVQYMVRALLRLNGNLQVDASDALAIALCHSHRSVMDNRLSSFTRSR